MSTGDVDDVAVVGEGFGGVTAAREVAGSGNDVALLEARDRLGSRTDIQTWHDEVIELGARGCTTGSRSSGAKSSGQA